jgi:hypothetical protein
VQQNRHHTLTQKRDMFTDWSFDTNCWKHSEERSRKVQKYKDLLIEVQHIWCGSEEDTIKIIGVTWSLSGSFQKYLEDISGKHSSVELQKMNILGTAHIVIKMLTWHLIWVQIYFLWNPYLMNFRDKVWPWIMERTPYIIIKTICNKFFFFFFTEFKMFA